MFDLTVCKWSARAVGHFVVLASGCCPAGDVAPCRQHRSFAWVWRSCSYPRLGILPALAVTTEIYSKLTVDTRRMHQCPMPRAISFRLTQAS